jgi:hypothetical protein
LPLADLVRQSYRADWRAMRMSTTPSAFQDPAFRPIGSEKVLERGSALTSRLQSFETETDPSRKSGWSGRSQPGVCRQGEATDSQRRVVPDMNSSEIRAMATRGTVPTTDSLSPPAINPRLSGMAGSTMSQKRFKSCQFVGSSLKAERKRRSRNGNSSDIRNLRLLRVSAELRWRTDGRE